MKTNIDILHNSHWITNGRCVGKTIYTCHSIAGQLLVLPPGSTVAVLIPNFQYLTPFTSILIEVLAEYGLNNVTFDQSTKRLFIRDLIISTDHPANYIQCSSVKFLTPGTPTLSLAGLDVSPNQYVLFDVGVSNGEILSAEFERRRHVEYVDVKIQDWL